MNGKFFCIFLLILFIVILPVVSEADYSGETPIRVVLDNAYPPFSFLDNEGKLQGLLIDQWNIWENKTGIPVKLTGMDWSEALTNMKEGEFDVIDTIFLTEERQKYFDFSRPYTAIEVPIFFSRNISGISGPESLHGFIIAVKAGDTAIDFLSARGITEFIKYPDYESIIRDAKEGKIVVFCVDDPPARYYLNKYGISGDFHKTQPLYTGKFYRAVRKGNIKLLKEIETGFNSISTEEYQVIRDKWYGTPLANEEQIKNALIGFSILIIITIILGIWIWTLNITVRKKTNELKIEAEKREEQAEILKESEDRYRNLVGNISAAVYRIRPEPRPYFSFISNQITMITGYRPEELLNNPDIFDHLIHPDDQPQVTEGLTWTDHDGETYEREYRMIRSDGEIIWVSDQSTQIRNLLGRIICIDGLITNINRRKEIEETLALERETLENIINYNPLAIQILSTKCIRLKENSSFKALFGRKEEENKDSGTPFDGISNMDEALKMAREGRFSILPDMIWRPLHEDEKELSVPLWIRTIVFPVFDDQNNVAKIVCMYEDITDQKQSRQALIQTGKKLNLLYNVTFNDIKNYILYIRGYLDLALSESEPDILSSNLNLMKKASENMSGALSFIAEFQDIGKKPAEWQNVEHSIIFAASHLNLLHLNRKMDLKSLEIFADPLLERVFYHLMENVIMHASEATMYSCTYLMTTDNLTIFFEDNGQGIPDIRKEEIFVHPVSDRKGLGLTFIREILSITDITIKETGIYGKGARFEIIIPPGGYRFVPDDL